MKIPKVITIDYETDAIEPRPYYPPKPVGVSIKYPGKASKYYAWGHPCENNCTAEEARNALLAAYETELGLLFHHAKFDVDVGEVHMGLPRLSWERYHDTMYLLFLKDPHAPDFKLKPSSERLLDMPPDEQDAVKDWLVAKGVVRKNDSKWGAYISKAPGKLVGKYANGDVDRTHKLFVLVWAEVYNRGMQASYDTERELMPILLDNEREGVRINMKQLEADFSVYSDTIKKVDSYIRTRLKVKDLNVDSNADLAEALDAAGVVTEWVYTKTGKRSTSKENMTLVNFKDPKVARALGYRTRLATCLGTFMEPWLLVARETGGIIHTNWNQTRQSGSGGKDKGTRTGRLSSNPNFQNIPKDFYSKGDGYAHPDHLGILPLPLMRDYMLPDKGCMWGHRDYNQQELRVLAHFEDGALAQAYRDTPRIDMHNFVKDKITEIVHKEYERGKVKVVNFGILYGQGAASMAVAMECGVEEAMELKKAHGRALPDVADLEKEIKKMGKAGEAIVTWNGREYFTEPPMMFQGRKITFEYKLLNYLIQGSAADMSKRSIIRYNEMKKDGRFMITVHDEINISVPKGAVKSEMKALKEAMEDIDFGVPILSDGKTGKCWGQLNKYKD